MTFGRLKPMRRRFRWTRKLYRQAHRLARFFAGRAELPHEPPALLWRYWQLWQYHPQRSDPLLLPLRGRLRDSDIPY